MERVAITLLTSMRSRFVNFGVIRLLHFVKINVRVLCYQFQIYPHDSSVVSWWIVKFSENRLIYFPCNKMQVFY